MKRIVLVFLALLAPKAQALNYGFNVGLGVPYLSQFGLNIVSDYFSADIGYNSFSVNAGLASVSLTKPEVSAKWHVFGGAFFLGLGLGQQTLEAKATDATTGISAKVSVTAMTMTTMAGFLWGKSDGGLIWGIDVGHQIPSGAKTTVDSLLPTDNEAYRDAVDEGNKFGSTSLPLFTILRVGYLF